MYIYLECNLYGKVATLFCSALRRHKKVLADIRTTRLPAF